jgi:polysaccharide biosynthesis/export protein
MRSSRLLIVALAPFALAACASQGSWQAPWQEATAPPPVEAAKVKTLANHASAQAARFPRVATKEASSYRLDTGDRVRVLVAGQDSLSNSYDVDVTGSIEIPSVGAVPARGLSTVQLSGMIAKRLKQGTTREPHVAVQVETYRPFTIRGDVANPGQYPYVNNMTTETAISIAGGLKKPADPTNVTINNGEPDNNPPTGSVPERPVRPGDIITVNPARPGDGVTVTDER